MPGKRALDSQETFGKFDSSSPLSAWSERERQECKEETSRQASVQADMREQGIASPTGSARARDKAGGRGGGGESVRHVLPP